MRKLAALTLVLFLIGACLFALPAAAAPGCATGWGSTVKTSAQLSPAPIDRVRAGRHDCYDRLVFDVAGRAGGYRVEYVSTVLSEGQGAPLVVPGGARLSVNVGDPVGGASWPVGGRVVDVAGFATFRSVVFGGSFEGHAQFGVGTRARLPFRVFVVPAAGGRSSLVLDVARSW